MDRKTLILILAASFLTLLILFVFNDQVPQGHDIYAHLTYAKLFEEALKQGQFPVRWTEWIAPGYSQPLFNYYQVGFYYLVFLLNFIFNSFVFSVKLAVVILWLFGITFTYIFTERYGPLPATIAAIFYAVSPYIVMDIFVRSAFPEFMALSFMPAVFWAIDRLIATTKQIFIALLGLFLGVALISHLPTGVIYSPLIAGYSVVLLVQSVKWEKRAISVFGGILLSVGLSAFYTFPAILELDFIQMNRLTVGGFDFRENFIDGQLFNPFFNLLTNGKLDIQGLLPAITILIIYYISIVTSIVIFTLRKPSRYLIFWLSAIIFVIIFITQESIYIWERLKVLSYIQFPWRYLMIISFAASVLTAVIISRLKPKNIIYKGIVGLLLITVVTSLYSINSSKLIDVSYFDLPFKIWAEHPETKKQAYFEHGYLPRDVQSLPQSTLTRWSVNNDIQIIKSQESIHQISLEVLATTNSKLFVNTHYFPGWKVYVQEKEVPVDLLKDSVYMGFFIPAGFSKIAVKFENTPIRTIANIATLISIMMTVFIFGRYLKKQVNLRKN